jgi:hypothetical protein
MRARGHYDRGVNERELQPPMERARLQGEDPVSAVRALTASIKEQI